MSTVWHIGNTTVRTPYRLREALIALADSPLNGNLLGKEQEHAFAKLLHDNSIVTASRILQGKQADDLGRKWRSALDQLGFISPNLTQNKLNNIAPTLDELNELPYEITPSGKRLIQAQEILSQQECFLRSLVGYRLPSPLETRYPFTISFHPLLYVLEILTTVKQLSFDEFALFVQTSTCPVEDTIRKIETYRTNKTAVSPLYEVTSVNSNISVGTLRDYADLTFRYLDASGLIRKSGKHITLSPLKKELISHLLATPTTELSDSDYLRQLWTGAPLPTDDKSLSYSILTQLTDELERRGKQVTILPKESSIEDIEVQRKNLEAELLQLDELEFAKKQNSQFKEISDWMDALTSRNGITTEDGSKLKIPNGEGPAYFEWIIWRAFLAINYLTNQPWEARRFEIDQNLLPVRHAPGGGPDMIFEFKDSVVIVEVTLSQSARQEAMEGAPVRAHVAKYAELTTKEVYGLFIAVEVDSNTAHTFKHGDWYLKNDEKISLNIVPLKLEDFKTFFKMGITKPDSLHPLLKQLLLESRAKANLDAPQWKAAISSIVQKFHNSNSNQLSDNQ